MLILAPADPLSSQRAPTDHCAGSPTDCAIGLPFAFPHGLLAYACLLMPACLPLPHMGSLGPFPGLSRRSYRAHAESRSTGLGMARMGIAGSILMRMHGSGMTAMGSEAVSGRSEGDWRGDGMNALRGRSKGLCGAHRA